MFSKNIGHQRQREPIKNQPFIQLISATMKIISDSNYGTELSLQGEIIVFCHWLQRSTLYSENTYCVTLPNRIFDARYVVAQDLFYFLPTGVRHRLFILSSHKIVKNEKSLALENTVSPTNFNHWFPTVLKGISHSSRTQNTIWEEAKKSAILMVKYNESIFSSTYYGARILITFMAIIIIFLLYRSSQCFNE